jgi:hypothetical protein
LEFLIVAVIILAFIIVMTIALRQYFPKNFIEYLEQLGKRDSNQRFDN